MTSDSSLQRTGSVIADRYRLQEVIGSGAMGLVYRAEHVLMKKPFAVKILHADLTLHQELVARFRREAETVAQIDHPNVCAASDFGLTEDGSLYMVMEYLEGQTLADVLEDHGRIPVRRAVDIARQVAGLLEAASDKGIVHRDLKPENIMLVERDGQEDFVKVLDFGIAKLMNPQSDGDVRLTQAGSLNGTPVYMSPEQVAGGQVDARSDLYSLGVLLFEMICGIPPFDSDNVLDLLQMHILEKAPSARATCPQAGVPPRLDRIIDKLLAKKPSHRFQSAGELQVALEHAFEPGGGWRDWSLGARIGLVATAVALVGGSVALAVVGGSPQPVGNDAAQARNAMAEVDPSGAVSPEQGAKVAESLAQERERLLADRREFQLAEQLVVSGDAGEAMRALRGLIDSTEHPEHVHYLIGAAGAKLGGAQGLEDFEKALELRPQYAWDETLLQAVFGAFVNPDSPETAEKAAAIIAGYLGRSGLMRLDQLAREATTPTVRQRAYETLIDTGGLSRLEHWRRMVIELQAAESCEERRAVVVALQKDPDARALPALERLAASTQGCGPTGQEDCHACMRDKLERVIAELAGK